MTELDQVIANAFGSEGKQDDVNKVYLLLLRTTLFIPVQKNPDVKAEAEPFTPLFGVINDQIFMVGFDTLAKLQQWAKEEADKLDYVELTGRDVIAGIGDSVFLGINPATDYYKEFSPDEIKRLKMIVSRIDQLKNQAT
jgi:hypothetical protein